MAKFYGSVGYGINVETAPGVWTQQITESNYYGDTLTDLQSTPSSGTVVNDDFTIDNKISILADPYANSNFSSIKYVTYMGVKWKVKSVEVLFPRLILKIGGLYNG